jgi:glycosyltransferase involved in cell wall biosynthesis
MPVSIGERFGSTVSLRSARHILHDTFAIFYRLRVLHFYERDSRGKPDASLLNRRAPSGQIEADEDMTSTSQKALKRKLRILVLNWRDITHPQAGGAEVYTHRVADEWVKEGHDVTLFCAAVSGRPSTEDFDGLRIIRRGTRHSVYREAKRYYRREGRGSFDLVVDEVNTRPFGAIKWVADVPVIALIHQVCREIWYRQTVLPVALIGRFVLEPLWLREYRNVLTVTLSDSSKESLEDYGLTRVVVVPVGFRSAGDRPEVPRETRPTVVFVGRLSSNKRPDEAIQAFGLLRETMPDAVLWLIGTGPMEDELRMSAPEGVQFLGKISESEKIERLARAHALVLTSVREGWGLVVTEAAAVGTPTIAYDVAGLRDSVRASNGVLSAPNPKDLGAVLEKCLATWLHDGLPDASPGGVITWREVADTILSTAMTHNPILENEPVRVLSEGLEHPDGFT